jgi:hypothetical protein
LTIEHPFRKEPLTIEAALPLMWGGLAADF